MIDTLDFDLPELDWGEDDVQRRIFYIPGEDDVPPMRTYRVYPLPGVKWRGNFLPANEPIVCRICGRDDNWGHEGGAFVCCHGRVEYFEAIRNIESFATRLADYCEVAHEL